MTETEAKLKLGVIEGVLPDVHSPDDLVAFVACDSIYAEQHALAFIASCRTNSPSTRVHLHLVNPDEGLRTRLTAEVAMQGRTAAGYMFTYTWEDTDGLGDSERSWFACSRFVRGAQIASTVQANYLFLDADCLVRKPLHKIGRDVGLFFRRDHPDHMQVAAGAVHISNTEAARNYLALVSKAILENFGSAEWYVDQLCLNGVYKILEQQWGGPTFHQIGMDFMDWEFGDTSTIWTGKGPRKDENPTYVELLEHWRDIASQPQWQLPWLDDINRVLILHPEPGMSYKKPPHGVAVGQPKGELASIRDPWLRFASDLAEAYRCEGNEAVTFTLPNWLMTPELVDYFKPDLAIIPHRQKHQFKPQTPCKYYMQMYDRNLFTLDEQGWGAEASRYPLYEYERMIRHSKGFENMRSRLVDTGGSKFDQPDRTDDLDLPEQYIFFPCQLPHDENVVQHCAWTEVEVMEALATWCRKNEIWLVCKEHPANPASMEPLREAVPEGEFVTWAEGNIHDLIAGSAAVYTLNSGVGFEALLQDKPVINFGKADYDIVTWAADLTDSGLDEAWKYATGLRNFGDAHKFVSWYVEDYAIDLTREGAFGQLRQTTKRAA